MGDTGASGRAGLLKFAEAGDEAADLYIATGGISVGVFGSVKYDAAGDGRERLVKEL